MAVYRIDDAFIAEINRIIRKVDGIRFNGINGANSYHNITIGPARTPPPAPTGYGSFGYFVITGPATRPGVYTANPARPPTKDFNYNSTSAFALTDICQQVTDTTVYLANEYEMNKDPSEASQHDIESGSIWPAVYVCTTVADDSGNKAALYLFTGLQPDDCSS